MNKMKYIVSSTEKHNEKCSTFETKSMLYLLNYHSEKDEVNFYVVDFYNDVTGVDSVGEKAWDIQSKGEKNISPMKIGEYLVTLFKNYLSCFSGKFAEYILFVEGVSNTVRLDNSKVVNKISDLNSDAIIKIKEGLVKNTFGDEYTQGKNYMKEYVDSIEKNAILGRIPTFLEKFTLVIDNKDIVQYVKDITELGINVLPTDDKLKKVFEEIKIIQNGKKTNSVEGLQISNLKDFTYSKKYLERNDIVLLVSSRILNIKGDLEDVNPTSFNSNLSRFRNDEDKREFIEDCRNDLYKLMFDKNNAQNYWLFFEEIWLKVKENRKLTVDQIYELCDKQKVRKARIKFDSAKYFISIVKEGLV